MLARIRKAMDDNEEGFTLIELLVVMIIIGILAAIAIPVFLNQRAKAADTAAKADVSTLGKEIATYWVDATTAPAGAVTMSTATVPGAGIAADHYVLAGRDVGKASAGVVLGLETGSMANTATTPTAVAWCISVKNDAGDKKTWKYSATGGLAQGICP